MTPRLIAVMGPTGSGKSFVAEHLADGLSAQLINADAFQVYRGLDIGTNKPAEKSRYALLDLVDPTEPFGLGQWVRLASEVLVRCWQQGRDAVVVGGTGLYVRALFEGYDAMAAAPDPGLREELNRIEREQGLSALVKMLLDVKPDIDLDFQNPVRVKRAIERSVAQTEPVRFELPPFSKLKLGVEVDSVALDSRLRQRVVDMLERGWIEEVQRLLSIGVPTTSPGFRAIGYQSVAEHLSGAIDRGTLEEDVYRATRRYAKRQRTWLRAEQRLTPLAVGELTDEGIRQAAEAALTIVFGRGD